MSSGRAAAPWYLWPGAFSIVVRPLVCMAPSRGRALVPGGLGAAPLAGAEDLADRVRGRPGGYSWLGNGEYGGPGGCTVHNPRYDFNDEISVLGASYWARLVETTLPRGG